MTVTPQNRFAQDMTEGHAADPLGAGGADSHERGPAAARKLAEEFAELKEFAAYYLAARRDALNLTLKQAVIYAALGVVGLIVLSNLLFAATVAMVVGIAAGLAKLFGEQAWLGPLVTGVGLLLIISLCVYLAMRRITGKSRARTIKKYERRLHQQNAQFGHNLHDEARSGAEPAERK